MRYGADIERFGVNTEEKIEISISRVEESRRYRDCFDERKRRSVVPIEYLKHIEFDLDTEDSRVAAHFVAKTLQMKGQVTIDPSTFSVNFLKGERWRFVYGGQKENVLHDIDFCDPFYILIFDDKSATGKKYQGYFERVVKCDTDVVDRMKDFRTLIEEKVYDLIIFLETSDIIWKNSMKEVRAPKKETKFAVISNNSSVLENAVHEGIPSFEPEELVDLERELIPKRYSI